MHAVTALQDKIVGAGVCIGPIRSMQSIHRSFKRSLNFINLKRTVYISDNTDPTPPANDDNTFKKSLPLYTYTPPPPSNDTGLLPDTLTLNIAINGVGDVTLPLVKRQNFSSSAEQIFIGVRGRMMAWAQNNSQVCAVAYSGVGCMQNLDLHGL